jgi:hypothetical protein
LLVFIVVAFSITTAATMMLLNSSQNATRLEVGTSALQVAESGMDNALIRLLRDPSYTGETLTVGEGTAVITVTGSGPYTLTSVGTVGRNVRKLQVTANYSGVQLVITPPWQEIP